MHASVGAENMGPLFVLYMPYDLYDLYATQCDVNMAELENIYEYVSTQLKMVKNELFLVCSIS